MTRAAFIWLALGAGVAQAGCTPPAAPPAAASTSVGASTPASPAPPRRPPGMAGGRATPGAVAESASGARGDAQGSASPAPRGSASGARGAHLYQKNCAACHGTNAQGAPNWQQRGPDGKFPAPPLNGSAHDWHHPKAVLVRIIKDGTARLGGNMPAWRDKLSDDEIEAIIAWFQSLWPEEIYAAWKRMDESAQENQRGQ